MQETVKNQHYEHSTGWHKEDPGVHQGTVCIHCLPGGQALGRFGLMTHDTQHVEQYSVEFGDKSIQCYKQEHAPGYNKLKFFYQAAKGKASIVRTLHVLDDKHAVSSFAMTNHGNSTITVPVTISLNAKFRSTFEVRGNPAARDAVPYERDIALDLDQDIFSYKRVDNGKTISTFFRPITHDNVTLAKARGENGQLIHTFNVTVPAGETATFGHDIISEHGHETAIDAKLPTLEEWRREFGLNYAPDAVIPKKLAPLATAVDQLYSMMIPAKEGIIFSVGRPNFLNPFGRDMLETALKIMPQSKEERLAYPWRTKSVEGIFRFLGEHRCREDRHYTPPPPPVASQNAYYTEPFLVEMKGAIIHEEHKDELSGLGMRNNIVEHPLGKVPFGKYAVGGEEAALFVSVLSEYCKKTENGEFAREMRQPVEDVLDLLKRPDLTNEHGFLCYDSVFNTAIGGPTTNKGGWRDAYNAVMLPDGTPFVSNQPGEPHSAKIALVEVQGYKYRTLTGASEMYTRLAGEARAKGDMAEADALHRKASGYLQEAEELQKKFFEHFLTKDRNGNPMYAMAVGYREGIHEMAKMTMHGSAPGHALWTGIFGEQPDKVMPVIHSLNHLWNGFGFRTLGHDEPGYDTHPDRGYHNGPVWVYEPIPEGLERYTQSKDARLRNSALKLIDKATYGIYELASITPGHSLAELASGDERKALPGGKIRVPTPMNTASDPQLWSAAAGAMLENVRKRVGLPSVIGKSAQKTR